MSDRTWNHIDARLYEEDWSEEAIIIAACMIARCPNQYGVFDTPMGFLTKFFRSFFAREQIELVLTELEGAGFLKFYNGKRITWIVAKWKRSHKPSANHWKGANTHLESGYNAVIPDFTAYYERYWDSIGIPLVRSGEGVPNTMPKSDTDSDTDSDKRLKDNTCPAKNAGRAKKEETDYFMDGIRETKAKAKKKKPEPKTKPGAWLIFFKEEFEKRKGHKPSLTEGDVNNAYKQYSRTVRIPHTDKVIRGVTKYYLSLKDDVWKGHKPHVMFNNFDRLLEGMMEHQAKFEKRQEQGARISSAQTEWEREQAEMQNNPDEVPDKYKLPEATDDTGQNTNT